MNKYIFNNYRTRRFSQKTFVQQGDFFIIADVVSVDSPSLILDVVPMWGTGNENEVREAEINGTVLPKRYYEPFYGEFLNVPWVKPLYKQYTSEDAYMGLCKYNSIGEFVCNSDGSLKVFNSIRVFCIINPYFLKFINNDRQKNLPDIPIQRFLPYWEPEYRAKYKKEYCYVEIY